MRKIRASAITQAVAQLCQQANFELGEDALLDLTQAQQTEAHLNNANLLLTRKAEIDTKPQLEIYADDVKCSHGTTVGQLEEAQLFYLRSRGITEDDARALLASAFAREVTDRLPVGPLAQSLRDEVIRWLPGKGRRGARP